MPTPKHRVAQTLLLIWTISSPVLAADTSLADKAISDGEQTPGKAAGPARPNIVFILADDLGWSDTTLYGTTRFYKTPRLQQLAENGMTFTRAYAASPLCSPTRASILTGQNPARLGLTAPTCHLPQVTLKPSVARRGPPNAKALQCQSVTRLDTRYHTLAEALKEAGYATAHFGKWHLGPEPYAPVNQGFGLDIPTWHGPGPPGSFVAPWKHPTFKAKYDKEHIEDRMGDEAVAFIKRHVKAHPDKPFFLNYWQFSVHAPFDAKQELIAKYRKTVDPTSPQRSPTYAAMVQSLDDNVGKLLDALDALGLAKNTVVIFFSDNGGNMYNTVDGTSPTSNLPLRGGKATMFEGGIRVPMVVRWPGITRARSRSDTIVQSTDLFPTFAALLNLERREGQVFDGVNLAPVLRGRRISRKEIFTYFPHAPRVPDYLPPSVAIHRGQWKMIRVFYDGPRLGTQGVGDGKPTHRYLLFDLQADPGERNNLAATHPAVVKLLDSGIDAFLKQTNAVTPAPNPAYDPKAPPPPPGKRKPERKPVLKAGKKPAAKP